MFAEERSSYNIGAWLLDGSRGTLSRDGEEIHLRRKSFDVLFYLIDNRDRLVSKDELISHIWPDTAVTDDVLVQSIKEIRRSFDDDPHKPRFVKTIPKSGYRFIGPVEVQARSAAEDVTADATKVNFVTDPPPALTQRRAPMLALAAILVLAGFSAGWLSWASGKAVATTGDNGRRSVAVMFFENRSNNSELDWLREGLPDMLIADLSRSEKLSVFSRSRLADWIDDHPLPSNSERAAAQLEAARQLKAGVLVTGSFVQIGERVRLDVQLQDSNSGTVIAAESMTVEKLEQMLTDIDLLSLKLARHLDAVPDKESPVSETMTNDLAAYRYYSLGVEQARGLHTEDAVVLLKKAIVRDPRFAMAHARIGYAYAVTAGRNDEGKPYLEKAYQLADRLTEKDRLVITGWYDIANLDFASAISQYREILVRYPLETEAYGQLANLLAGEGQRNEAVAVVRQGLAADPEAKNLYNLLGTLLSQLGRHGDAIAAHQRYVELAPNEPNAYDSLGISYQWSGDYPMAIENYDRALQLNPRFGIVLIHLANTYFRLGQYQRSIELFRKYVDIAQNDGDRERGYSNLALVYLRLGDMRSANAFIQRIVSAGKTWPLASYFVARSKGQAEKAHRIAVERAEIIPVDRGRRGNPRFPLYYRGILALDEGRNDEAIDAFRSLLNEPPPAWNIYDFEDSLANTFLRLGRNDEAIAEYERILALSPNYPLAHFSIARAWEAKGRPDLAKASYEKFLAEWTHADTGIEVDYARSFVARN